jgi:hypothetical protein
LAIKVEIDTNPPESAGVATSFVHNHVTVHLQHHDPGSLLAGKLHAILHREYVKGRDWYDLWWYLKQSQWPSPNLEMLNSALGQSGWKKDVVTGVNWRPYILERLAQLSWDRIVEDVQRFLMMQEELAEFKIEAI